MDKISRCGWCKGNKFLEKYHDTEWGLPSWDDCKYFEFFVLYFAEAELKWPTILKMREIYKKAYDNYDINLIANYGEEKIEELLNNEEINQSRIMILAAINNAKCFLDDKLQKEYFGFCQYLWSFNDNKPILNKWEKQEDVPIENGLAHTICRELKKIGFRFINPKFIYSLMQAMGLVNDHLVGCYRRFECKNNKFFTIQYKVEYILIKISHLNFFEQFPVDEYLSSKTRKLLEKEEFDKNLRAVLIEMSEVKFFHEGLLYALLAIDNHFHNISDNIKVIIINPHPTTKLILEILKVDKRLPVFESEKIGLEHLNILFK